MYSYKLQWEITLFNVTFYFTILCNHAFAKIFYRFKGYDSDEPAFMCPITVFLWQLVKAFPVQKKFLTGYLLQMLW